MNIYSLEQTHLQYGTQLYDVVAKKNKITTFQKEKLQNSALRKITFKKCHKRSYMLCIQRMQNNEISWHPKSSKLSLFMYQIQHSPKLISASYLFLLYLYAKKQKTSTTTTKREQHTIF